MEFPLNILPPEMIDLIAERLSIMDCLNTLKAFARDPEDAVNNIRTGLAANLTKQSALYLLMDRDKYGVRYEVKYQYNYRMESELPNALLPTLEKLPISSESSKMITLPDLEKGGSLGSIGRLKQTFPNVVELKVVLRTSSFSWPTKLAKVVVAFSRQLTGLQLLIFSDLTTPWGAKYLLRLFSHLNDAHFDHLRHFTLLFEDMKAFFFNPRDLKLLSSETLEECYLRLPSKVIEPQMKLLRENQRLQRLGIIAFCIRENDWDISYIEEIKKKMEYFDRINTKILTSPFLTAKIVHLLFPEGYRSRKIAASFYGWQIDLIQLDQYTSLQTLRISLDTGEAYLTLMHKLRRLGSLTHLQISLRYVPVSELTFCRPLSELTPCSPSVTHLKIEVESIPHLLDVDDQEEDIVEFSHLIFSHLSILRHFPSLQQLEVVFPIEYFCSLCKFPRYKGRECMEKAMQPFRARDQLKASFSQQLFAWLKTSTSALGILSGSVRSVLQLAWTLYFCSESNRVLQAFARDPEPAVNNIRNGLAINLTKQSALYLLMDTDEYDGKYQYNYQMEHKLPNAFLPTPEGLPISSESSKMITLPELEKGGSLGSIGRLKRTFPNVVELKVVLRDSSFSWLTKLAKVVKAFSSQLTALQLLIFSDPPGRPLWKNNDLLTLFTILNKAHFDHLRHFTLLFEDSEKTRIHPPDLKSLRLLSSETLEECYLRLPGKFTVPQLKLLGENQRLQRLGLIASCIGENEENEEEIDDFNEINEEILTSPSLSAKIVHLIFPIGYRSRKLLVADSFFGWQDDFDHLDQFTSLRTLLICLNTGTYYLRLMNMLSRLGSLKHLQIRLLYFPVNKHLIFNRLSQLAPCSPSVTHLKIKIDRFYRLNPEEEAEAEGRYFQPSHLIFTHLSILRHFPNLQQLEVVFPREYSCPLCRITPADDGRECMEKAMRPFRARDQLQLSFRQSQ
ncbi:hypothetical protein TYRP_017995 [Tyrophagus putrescentiae]|nr:hypothetical protein TYRP_017995 [Tyrophagus putrescentiae]